MKFLPAKLLEIITKEYESSEVTIIEPGEIYCKTLSDKNSWILFKNGIEYRGQIVNGILNG